MVQNGHFYNVVFALMHLSARNLAIASIQTGTFPLQDHRISTKTRHCISDNQEKGIQIGPNWDLSKALNNRYRLLLLRIDRYPGHFGVLLIKIHLLAFVVVAIKWIIRPKTKKNLFS